MRTTLPRTLAAALLGLSMLTLTPAPASAGGTAVVAPAELRPDDCRTGTAPKILGYPPADLIVLGCIARGEREFLVAGEGGDPFTCLYVAPEGGKDIDGVCRLPREGLAPLRFSAMAVDRNRDTGRVFAWGLARRDEDGVTLVSTGPGGKDRRRHSTLLRVGESDAQSVGIGSAFSIHLALASSDSVLCDGLFARRWERGRPLGEPFRRGSRRFGSGIDLPGSRGCA